MRPQSARTHCTPDSESKVMPRNFVNCAGIFGTAMCVCCGRLHSCVNWTTPWSKEIMIFVCYFIPSPWCIYNREFLGCCIRRRWRVTYQKHHILILLRTVITASANRRPLFKISAVRADLHFLCAVTLILRFGNIINLKLFSFVVSFQIQSLLCNGYRVSFQGYGFNHPPPYTAEVKERVELYLYSPSGFHGCSRANFNFYFLLARVGH